MTNYKPNKLIPLLTPNIGEVENAYIQKCIESQWVAYNGPMVTEFEKKISAFIQVENCVATNTGTAALHLALLCLDVKPNDMVITTPFSFVSSVNSIKYVGADPIFIDVREDDWQMDPDILHSFLLDDCIVNEDGCYHKTSGRRIACLLLVHTLGFTGDLLRIMNIVKTFNLKIVEDAACGLGSYFQNRHLGTFGDVGCFSFNGNKIITTGGGGALVTNDIKIAKKAYHLSTQAKSSLDYNHDSIGFNYRMTALSAALGIGQLERIEEFIKHKSEIYNTYQAALEKITGIELPFFREDSSPNCWLFAARIPQAHLLSEYLKNKNIETRPLWRPLQKLSMFSSSLFITENDIVSNISTNSLSFPSSTTLTLIEQQYIIHNTLEYYLTVK